MKPQSETTNVILCGVGGQGILLAGRILAVAALEAGLDVKKAEVHGMAQRGGSVITHVRFGERVFSPLIASHQAHFMLAFEPLEALRYLDFMSPDGTIFINQQKILPQPVRVGKMAYPGDIVSKCKKRVHRLIAINATHNAESIGDPRVANLIFLGMLSRFLSFPESTWQKAIQACIPSTKQEINIRAFQFGRDFLMHRLSIPKKEIRGRYLVTS